MQASSIKTLIKAASGIAAGAMVAFQQPPDGMTVQGMQALGIVVWAITWWVFAVLPEYVTAMLMGTFFVLFKLVDFDQAFATFAGSTMWLLMSALGLGAAAAKSGLLKRVALLVMSRFPLNFRGQILGLLGVGLVTAPFIPSTNAKVAMLAPLTRAISDAMGYRRKSQAAAGLFGAMFTGVCNMAPVFISASVLGFLIQGFLPPEVRAQFTFTYWVLCALPWTVVMSVLNYLAIIWLYKPDREDKLGSDFINQQITELGPMQGIERFTAVVILITFGLWSTEALHGITPAVVAMLSLCMMIGRGVLTREDFRSRIPWDSLIFIGATINLSVVFEVLEINNWVVSIFSPFISHFAGSIYLFIVVLALVTYVVRVILVSQMAYISIFLVFLVPLAVNVGINPWVVGFIIYATVNSWLFFFQNPIFLTAFYAANGDLVDHSQTIKLCLAYMVIAVMGLFASVPLWQILGLVP
jgi:DASS family divalent anion:Na+ symporter